MVRGVTTWGDAIQIQWADLSYGRIFHDDRYRLRYLLNARLNGRVFFTYTTPRVANADNQPVRDQARAHPIRRERLPFLIAPLRGRYRRVDFKCIDYE